MMQMKIDIATIAAAVKGDSFAFEMGRSRGTASSARPSVLLRLGLEPVAEADTKQPGIDSDAADLRTARRHVRR